MLQQPCFEGKVLLTGGAGFVGGHLVRRLLAQGTPLRLLARRPAKVPQHLPAAEVVQGDINDPRSLAAAMEGAAAVVHLVGIIRERRGAGFHKVHVQGTENVLRACRRAGVARLLHMSALGARPDARACYHRTKWAAEEAVRASGLDYTIFRPSVIFGSGDEFVNRLVRLVRRAPLIPVIGDGLRLLQPIWVEDVVSCFVQSLSKRETIGESYDLGGPETLGLLEIVEMIRDQLHLSKPILHFPVWLVRPQAWVMQRLLPNPPLTTEQLTMLQEDNVCDLRSVEDTFQLTWKRLETYLEELLSADPARAPSPVR